ncbi:L-tyrosine/L-tryptophan isonitrile synthase family protein [Algicola sagamiensis]|uniref:L-tyrosine/L-tryptophan isonitrile synthase family protein n=1 Tax=Algicola sagamiensis TaxID=163869 RepID=UPI00035C5145|nr:L-tyrosine/L-tryptophan isonitrile synthase family protein [Algicola sagamiensis]
MDEISQLNLLPTHTTERSRLAQKILDMALSFSYYNLFERVSETCSTQAEQFFAHQRHLIRRQLEKNNPISFTYIGFPAKSPNRDKTISHLPDMAEFLALSRLNHLTESVQSIYPPGAKVVICQDGHVFNDILQIPDQQVDDYVHALQAICHENQLTGISFTQLGQYFPKANNYEEQRAQFIRSSPMMLEDIRQSIRHKTMENMLFKGIHRLMYEDLIGLEPDHSRTYHRNQAKDLALSVMHRYIAWEYFIHHQFPDAVHFSPHPLSIEFSRIGLQLVPSHDSWATPWHHAAILDGSAYSLVKYKSAVKKNTILKQSSQGYAYFELIG